MIFTCAVRIFRTARNAESRNRKGMIPMPGRAQPPAAGIFGQMGKEKETTPPLVQRATRGVHIDSARPNIQHAYTNIPNAPEHGKHA